MGLRLSGAGNGPNSARALANLPRVCAALGRPGRMEVVDVASEPERALEAGVNLVPTLVRLAPVPARKLIGDLGDTLVVWAALDLAREP